MEQTTTDRNPRIPSNRNRANTMTPPLPHVVIFPFMSKGHTIPLLHLAHLLHRRRLATVTFLTTPLNAPFLRTSLGSSASAAIIELPFPDHIPDLPPGIESTDYLPSMSLFLPFISAIKLLRPYFDKALETLRPTLLISDGFHAWTLESATKLGIRRLAFYGMGVYAATVSAILTASRPHVGLKSETELFSVPHLPHIKLTKADIPRPFDDLDTPSPLLDFVTESGKAVAESHGIIVNSFYQMEAAYADHWNNHLFPKSWLVGPLCLAEPENHKLDDDIKNWLDARLVDNRPVLYVAFGTQAEVSTEQLKEIASGLEQSGVDFLWLVRSKASELGDGFEERVRERGLVVRSWVDQRGILKHDSVRAFMSHCGWNSVMESVCARVPILAWPMMAEQTLNAKLVVEELGIGVAMKGSEEGRNGLVRKERIAEMAREVLVGEKGKEAEKKVKVLGAAAMEAMEEGGSSWKILEEMISDGCNRSSGVETKLSIHENGLESSNE